MTVHGVKDIAPPAHYRTEVVILERTPIHYYNMAKIAYTRAGWVLSLPNTIGILFLIWTNAFFQDHYAGLFMGNFWVFMFILVVPFVAYMVFEYTRVWSAEIDIANQKSWGAAHNPMRELLIQTNREVGELRKLVERLVAERAGAGAQATVAGGMGAMPVTPGAGTDANAQENGPVR